MSGLEVQPQDVLETQPTNEPAHIYSLDSSQLMSHEHGHEHHVCGPERQHTQQQADEISAQLFAEIHEKATVHGELGHVCSAECRHTQQEADKLASSLFNFDTASDTAREEKSTRSHKRNVEVTSIEASRVATELIERANHNALHGEAEHICGTECQHTQSQADRFAEDLFRNITAEPTRGAQELQSDIPVVVARELQEQAMRYATTENLASSTHITELKQTSRDETNQPKARMGQGTIVGQPTAVLKQLVFAPESRLDSFENSDSDASVVTQGSGIELGRSITEQQASQSSEFTNAIDSSITTTESEGLSDVRELPLKLQQVSEGTNRDNPYQEGSIVNVFEEAAAHEVLISNEVYAPVQNEAMTQLYIAHNIKDQAKEIFVRPEIIEDGVADAVSAVQMVEILEQPSKPIIKLMVDTVPLFSNPDLIPKLEEFIGGSEEVVVEAAVQILNELESLNKRASSKSPEKYPKLEMALLLRRLSAAIGIKFEDLLSLLGVHIDDLQLSAQALEIIAGLKKLMQEENRKEFMLTHSMSPAGDTHTPHASLYQRLGELVFGLLRTDNPLLVAT